MEASSTSSLTNSQICSLQRRLFSIADSVVESETETLALHGRMDFIALSTVLRNLDQLPMKLKHLTLHAVDVDYNTCHELMEQLQEFQSLELIHCKGEFLSQLVSKSLQTVGMAKFCIVNNPTQQTTVQSLCDDIPESKVSELHVSLDLSSDSTRQLCSAMNSSTLLTSCSWNESEFSPDAIDALSVGLQKNSSMKSLSFDHCRLEDYELASIVDAIGVLPNLQHLSVRMNYAATDTSEALATLLQSPNCMLQCLDIAQQDPGDIPLIPFSTALEQNSTLHVLHLEESCLSSVHVPVLVRALRQNKTLQRLYMDNCDLGDSALSIILRDLGDFSLSHLSMTENSFNVTAETRTLLTDGLKKNHKLIHLKLGTPLPEQAQRYIRYNKGGRQFLAGAEPIPKGLWPHLLAQVSGSPSRSTETDSVSTAGSDTATRLSLDALLFILQRTNFERRL